MADALRRRQQRLQDENRDSGTGGVSDIDSDRAVINEEHMRRRIGQDKVPFWGRRMCLLETWKSCHLSSCSLLRPLMQPCLAFPVDGEIMLSGPWKKHLAACVTLFYTWLKTYKLTMNWRFIFTWLMIGGFCLIIYWGPLALMITVACVQVKVLFRKRLNRKPNMLLHVVTHVPSIVLCWDYQHRIRRLQNGQPSLVPVSLLVCSIFKLSRQIVSWHSGISSSLPTIFSTERPWWSNSVLSSTGY